MYGMNAVGSLDDRKRITEQLINDESVALQSGFNPFYKKEIKAPEEIRDISPASLLMPALYAAGILNIYK
jgi:hypothetical protein